jgi:hypothetical protein
MLDLLPPEGPGLLPLGHPRLDRPGHDPVEAAEVVAAVGEPGIDHVGLAHVLDPHGAVRLPGLREGLPDPLGRAAVAAVHRAPLDDDVFGAPVGDLLHVLLRHVGRVMARRPRGQGVIRRRHQQGGPGQQRRPHCAPPSQDGDRLAARRPGPTGLIVSAASRHRLPLSAPDARGGTGRCPAAADRVLMVRRCGRPAIVSLPRPHPESRHVPAEIPRPPRRPHPPSPRRPIGSVRAPATPPRPRAVAADP